MNLRNKSCHFISENYLAQDPENEISQAQCLPYSSGQVFL